MRESLIGSGKVRMVLKRLLDQARRVGEDQEAPHSPYLKCAVLTINNAAIAAALARNDYQSSLKDVTDEQRTDGFPANESRHMECRLARIKMCEELDALIYALDAVLVMAIGLEDVSADQVGTGLSDHARRRLAEAVKAARENIIRRTNL